MDVVAYAVVGGKKVYLHELIMHDEHPGIRDVIVAHKVRPITLSLVVVLTTPLNRTATN